MWLIEDTLGGRRWQASNADPSPSHEVEIVSRFRNELMKKDERLYRGYMAILEDSELPRRSGIPKTTALFKPKTASSHQPSLAVL